MNNINWQPMFILRLGVSGLYWDGIFHKLAYGIFIKRDQDVGYILCVKKFIPLIYHWHIIWEWGLRREDDYDTNTLWFHLLQLPDIFSMELSVLRNVCLFDAVLGRFVCSALRFIPYEPRKKRHSFLIFTMFPTRTLPKILRITLEIQNFPLKLFIFILGTQNSHNRTKIRYTPRSYLIVIDETHITVPVLYNVHDKPNY